MDYFTPQDRFRKTPLHYCCRHEDVACLQALLAGGADTNAQEEIGKTPLWIAASTDGHKHIIAALLDAGCNVDLQDAREKRSPLQVSILTAVLKD